MKRRNIKTPPEPLFCRTDWIQACEFHRHSEATVLKTLETEITRKIKNSRTPPAVIFDIDSTLYKVSPRTHAILREATTSLSRHMPRPVLDAMKNLAESNVGYSIADTFSNLGLSLNSPVVEKAWKSFKDFWWDRFFSNDYLAHDEPYTGAVEWVNRLHQKGAHILYLTGRNQTKMRQGTVNNLIRDGFPVETERTILQMKLSRPKNDALFKAAAAQGWDKQYRILASFENEPKNLIALQKTLPKSMSVFVETICSDKPAPRSSGLYRLKEFRVT